LTYQGKALRNWWEFVADFDMALAQGKSLVTDDVELSVKLSHFKVNYDDNQVSFEWNGGVENDNAGFNLWCAKKNSLNKPFKINPTIIPSQATSFKGTYYHKKYSPENFGLNLEPQYCVIEEVNNRGLCNIHCNFLTMMSLNDNRYLQSYDDLGLSKAKFSCHAYKVQTAEICLDKLLQ
jgi:hypothetical protein